MIDANCFSFGAVRAFAVAWATFIAVSVAGSLSLADPDTLREATNSRRSQRSFPIARDGDVVLLPVSIDATRHLLAIDTGSASTWLDNSFREQLGQPLRPAVVMFTDRTQRTVSFAPPRLVLGGEKMSAIKEVLCRDLKPFRDISGYEIDGIIGMDFLQRKIFRIDFDSGELTFLDAVPADPGESVPLTMSPDGLPLVNVRVAGTGTIPFLVDTGHVGSNGGVERRVLGRLLQRGDAEALQIGTVRGFVGDFRSRVAVIHGLELAAFEHSDLVVEEGPRNLLGLGYLSRYVAIFDFPGATLYLKPGARFSQRSRYDLSGLHLMRRDGRTFVHSIDDGSAAARMGMRPQDTIERISDRRAASLTMFQIRKMLSVPGEYIISLRRGHDVQQVTLRLEEPPGPKLPRQELSQPRRTKQ